MSTAASAMRSTRRTITASPIRQAAFATPSSTTGGRGWYGQAGGGCDYQFTLGNLGNCIVGVFADYDFMSIKGNIQTGFR